MKKNIYLFICSFLLSSVFSVSQALHDDRVANIHSSLKKILNECKAGMEKSKTIMVVKDLQTGKTLSTGKERVIQLQLFIDDLQKYLDFSLGADSQSSIDFNRLVKEINGELNAALKEVQSAVEFSEKAHEADNMDFLFHYEKKFNKCLKEIQDMITYADGQLILFDKRR